MLTHDCGSCVKERAVSVSLHARKLVARSERWREVGHTWKGGLESVVYSESLRHRRHEFFTHGYPRSTLPSLLPASFPSVNHRFEAVRLAKRLMCVAETREPPSPHPAKRRFRIFRTATRSGGMLILSVDRPPPPPTSEYFPTTLNALFVERVSKGEGRVFEHVFDALDFFSFFKFIERYSFDKFITLSYI